MKGGLVVVGGGPAAFAAAAAYREAGGGGHVRVVSADNDPPYNRPSLTKDYLRGEAEEVELSLEAPAFYAEREIELTLSTCVERLHSGRHTVDLSSGRSLEYETCILATGSKPATLPVPGGDDPSVHRMRFLTQARRLRGVVEEASSAVVVGSGFIGCEAASSLARRGLTVTMVSTEELPQLARLGREAAERIAQWLVEGGVRLVGGVEVESIRDGSRVDCADGTHHVGDVVLTAVGIEPQSGIATDAGLDVEHGRVVVDEHMRASAPDVFAAGDVAFARNGAAGRHLVVEHWGEALAMGEVAGKVAAGASSSWAQAPGFWSEIGRHSLKYSAWGDGYDDARFVAHDGDAFTVWYGSGGITVGVLTHETDADYEHGMSLVSAGRPLP